MKSQDDKKLSQNKKYLLPVLFALVVAQAGAATQFIHWGTSTDLLNGLTVTWNGAGTADSIRWGYTTAFEKGKFLAAKRSATPVPGNWFSYNFGNGITPSSTLYYKIKDSQAGTWGTQNTYSTVPAATVAGTNFTFCASGDSRDGGSTWTGIANKMAALNPSLVVFNGDITASGGVSSEWNTWFTSANTLNAKVPLLHAEGNHDAGSSKAYLNMFDLPHNGNNSTYDYYSMIYGNVMFITINAEISLAAQNTWMDTQLAAAQAAGIAWTVVSWHEPFYTNGSHAGEMDAMTGSATTWATFDKYGVDLLLNGHDHCYERTKPINRSVSTTAPVSQYGRSPGQGRCEIVCGGAGAPLYTGSTTAMIGIFNSINNYIKCDVTGCIAGTTSITITAYDGSGTVIDNFTLAKVCATGVDEPKTQLFNPISVSPNPVSDKFTLKYSSDLEGNALVKVFTLEGKEVRSESVVKSQHDLEYIGDLSGLAKGGYYVSVIMGSQRDNALILLK